MNITVYLGANEGNDPRLAQAVRELGRWIGESGNALIYGGSACGLMGELAKSVLDAGGKATGVEPQFFVDQGLLYDDLTELFITKDMTERKAKMIELSRGGISKLAIMPVMTSLTPEKRLNKAGIRAAAPPPNPHSVKISGMRTHGGIHSGISTPASPATLSPTANCPSRPMLMAPP